MFRILLPKGAESGRKKAWRNCIQDRPECMQVGRDLTSRPEAKACQSAEGFGGLDGGRSSVRVDISLITGVRCGHQRYDQFWLWIEALHAAKTGAVPKLVSFPHSAPGPVILFDGIQPCGRTDRESWAHAVDSNMPSPIICGQLGHRRWFRLRA